jgi:hypothetical protein
MHIWNDDHLVEYLNKIIRCNYAEASNQDRQNRLRLPVQIHNVYSATISWGEQVNFH